MAETEAGRAPQSGAPAIGKPQLSREEEADRDLRHTRFAPRVAWALCLLYLLTVGSVPAVQHVVEIGRNLAARREHAASPAGERPPLLPQSYDAFRLLPTLSEIGGVRGPGGALGLLPPVQEIRDYETALEEQSVVGEWVLPRMQYALTALLGAGNEQAYPGRDGWLMYRPDVDYLTGRGFLDTASLRPRAFGGEDETPQSDPVKAIVRFQRQLAARGIDLIVLPVPVKPMIHPEKLSTRYDGAGAPLQNPSYARFRRALEREGVSVFDVSAALADAKRRTGEPQFLETDTHWTPAAMERTAAALAASIRDTGQHEVRPAPGAETPGAVGQDLVLARRPAEASNLGDIAVMLRLPPRQRLYEPQRVRLHQVRAADGERWRPRRNASILLLGDSFSNIYSLAGMGWGEGAGFAEQLSFFLQRPLDTIVVNAGGAYAARQRLVRELARGRSRLAGKRLVIYEFAMRDLSGGDWKLLDLP